MSLQNRISAFGYFLLFVSSHWSTVQTLENSLQPESLVKVSQHLQQLKYLKTNPVSHKRIDDLLLSSFPRLFSTKFNNDDSGLLVNTYDQIVNNDLFTSINTTCVNDLKRVIAGLRNQTWARQSKQ